MHIDNLSYQDTSKGSRILASCVIGSVNSGSKMAVWIWCTALLLYSFYAQTHIPSIPLGWHGMHPATAGLVKQVYLGKNWKPWKKDKSQISFIERKAFVRKDNLSGWASWLMSKNATNTPNINQLLEKNAYTRKGASLTSSGHVLHSQSLGNWLKASQKMGPKQIDKSQKIQVNPKSAL